MIPRAFAVIALAWASQARADEPQYRQLTLVDDRVLTAEILSTEAQGLLLQMPQGRALVPFELLKDMVPTDVVAYDDQPAWTVWVKVPDAHQAAVESLLDQIPKIDGAMAGYGADITSEVASGVSECPEADIDCIALRSEDMPWRWIITGQIADDGGLTLFSRTNVRGARTAETRTLEKGWGTDVLWNELHAMLGLQPPLEGPPRANRGGTRIETPRPPSSERRVMALSFVPVPGITSLSQGDGAGFGLAVAIVAPTTAIWVGAVGRSSQTSTEFGVLSAAGFYVATVLTNQVMGMRTLRKNTSATVTVLPNGDGGATLSVGARF